MKLGFIVSLLLGVVGGAQAQQTILRPRLQLSTVEWPAVMTAMGKTEGLQASPREREAHILGRVNEATGHYLRNISSSAVPVLLPLDVVSVLRDRGKPADPNEPPNGERYFHGFHAPRFFLAGPAGYDSTFSIQTSDIKELSDISLTDPIDIHFSGLAFYYELEDPAGIDARPVPSLEAKFPGIRRLIQEGFVRYAFVRHGVPYVLAIDCFDGRPRILRLLCSQADRVAVHFLNLVQVAGGMPQQPPTIDPPLVVRPHTKMPVFTYHGPGRIFPASGFRGTGGRVDYTVYAPMRFPLERSPAYANSQLYRERQIKSSRASSVPTDYAYPWRDNFCERRGFTVGQCPGGIGHQGQDIRPAPCAQPLGNDRCDPPHHVVAVREGAIMRSPKQEAVYIVVNNADEHIRFRYLHMEPRKMDEENLLSGRDVQEGEVIGSVSTYSKKENGTSYHVHFDIQVPTKTGWVFVNPYMTLVVAYERLIGGRGVELFDSPQAAQAGESEPDTRPEPALHPSADRHSKAPGEDAQNTANQAGVNEPRKNSHE